MSDSMNIIIGLTDYDQSPFSPYVTWKQCRPYFIFFWML